MKANPLYAEVLFSVVVRQSNLEKVAELIRKNGRIKNEKTYTSDVYRNASFKFYATVQGAVIIQSGIEALEKEAKERGDNFEV